MPLTTDTPTMFTCVDPSGLRHEPKVTESAGVITGAADNGYFTTSRPEVARELQERYPHMLVTEHEKHHNNRATRVAFSFPLSLKEIEARYQQYLEAQKGAVMPQEDMPNEREYAAE